MAKNDWNLKDSPSLEGKIAIVTGANTGLGFETAKALAKKGAHVIMACRDLRKANAAMGKIKEAYPKASLSTETLDLGQLASVRAFAENVKQAHTHLHLLINNAGLMMPPYGKTKDGFEIQWGVNHLGHFLLTALLMPLLEAGGDARVVHLASLAHKWGEIYFEDLNFEKSYNKQKSYGQSKLACLMFGYELQRRLEAAGSSVKSIIAHPGISDTELSRYLPKWMQALSPVFSKIVAQSPRDGAMPTLRAALDTGLRGGEYIGPDGFGEMKGKPVVVNSHPKSKNKEVASELWKVSEKLTGHTFELTH